MKKNKILSLIFLVVSIVLIGSGILLGLKDNGKKPPINETPEVVKTITVDEILEEIPNTLEYKVLDENSKIALEKAENMLVFTDKTTNIPYEIKINNNKLNIPYDTNNSFLMSIYYILLEAVNLAYDNEIDLIYYPIITDSYLYSKIGVEKVELEDGKFELVLDFSKAYPLPSDLTYISEETLKYYGYDQKLKTRDSFTVNVPEMRVIKSSYNLEKIKVDIISSKENQDNLYLTVLTFSKLLLDAREYQDFIDGYDALKSVNYDNFEIIVDYTLTEEEKITINENEQIIRIYYTPEEFK